MGALWLLAAILLAGAALGVALGAPWWWFALPGVLLSQFLITQLWNDAKYGTIANVLIAVPLVVLALDARPSSFRSRFAHDRDALLSRATAAAPLVTEADLVTFDAAGDLIGFLSNDRTQEDGSESRTVPWSTPISGYREIDGIRIGTLGRTNWVETTGEWAYGKFEIRSIAYNVER